jgi:hypothetical protein
MDNSKDLASFSLSLQRATDRIDCRYKHCLILIFVNGAV